MQRKYLVRAGLILLIIAGSFFVLWTSSRAATTKKICSESMEECCGKTNKTNSSGEMIWETLSRQFFSSTEISN